MMYANAACAAQVVEDFESGNPDQWAWTLGAVLKVDGGNPGAWLDSGLGYIAQHPFVFVAPPAGSAFYTALRSDSLNSVKFDFARLDPGECFPPALDAGTTFALELADFHSSPGAIYSATFVSDMAVPDVPTTWQTFSFDIPPDAPSTPAGWALTLPHGVNYGWSDLLHNVDAIVIFVGNPFAPTTSQCRRLGIDNVVVTYGDDIFSSSFEVEATR